MPTYLLVSVLVCLSLLNGCDALTKRFERDSEDETKFNLTASPEFNVPLMVQRGDPFCILDGRLVQCNPPISVRYQTPTAPPSMTGVSFTADVTFVSFDYACALYYYFILFRSHTVDPLLCVVFWNQDVSYQVQTGITSYLRDLIATDFFDGLTEYGMLDCCELSSIFLF
jgi:hypothetical protein